jgi:hypothetical protein
MSEVLKFTQDSGSDAGSNFLSDTTVHFGENTQLLAQTGTQYNPVIITMGVISMAVLSCIIVGVSIWGAICASAKNGYNNTNYTYCVNYTNYTDDTNYTYCTNNWCT